MAKINLLDRIASNALTIVGGTGAMLYGAAYGAALTEVLPVTVGMGGLAGVPVGVFVTAFAAAHYCAPYVAAYLAGSGAAALGLSAVERHLGRKLVDFSVVDEVAKLFSKWASGREHPQATKVEILPSLKDHHEQNVQRPHLARAISHRPPPLGKESDPER